MDLESFFVGGTLLGMAAALWGYFKLIAWRIVNLAVCRARFAGYAQDCLVNIRRLQETALRLVAVRPRLLLRPVY